MKTILLTIAGFISLAIAVAGCHNKKLAAQQDIPACIAEKIKAAEADPQNAKISRIDRYRYKGAMVYYITLRHCNDCFNTIYNEQCKPICSPDGGFSGRGDGRCKDFAAESTEKMQLWPKP